MHSERGASILEYVIGLAFVSTIVVTSVYAFTKSTRRRLCDSYQALSQADKSSQDQAAGGIFRSNSRFGSCLVVVQMKDVEFSPELGIPDELTSEEVIF